MGWLPSCGPSSGLARFVCERAQGAGFARLAKAGKSTVWRILDGCDIKPHKIRYYLEKRDPDFDRKIENNRAHDLWHLVSRLYRKVAAHTLCVLLNRQLGRPCLHLDGLVSG